MTTTAAARAAVDPRPARGAAGRRAAQVVLFLGGLLALGLLAGGHAEAQERPEPGPLTASVADTVPERAAPEAAAPEAAVREAAEPPAQQVVDRVVDRVVEPVVQPAVKPVVTPVDRAARQTAQQPALAAQQSAAQQQAARQQAVRKPAAEPPAEPAAGLAAESAAAAPAHVLGSTPARVRDAVVVGAGDAVDRVAGEVRPLVPDLPGLPPLFSVLPVPGGEPDAPGAPSPSVPGTGRGAEGGTATPGDAGADTSVEYAERAAGRGIGAPVSAPAVPDGSGAPGAGHAQGPAPTPAPDRVPFDPCGDLVRTATADVQGPRGGDLHAVPAPGGPDAALVRGASLPATASPIPDRSGEILEFPG